MTAPQQQPVAARYFNQFNGWVVTHIEHAQQMHQFNGYPMQLLYAEPVQAQEHKPIAWMTEYGDVMHAKTHAKWVEFDGGRGCERFADYVIPLYTAPHAPTASTRKGT